jgi:hypothetical protein
MDLRTEYERVNRKYEALFEPKIRRAIHSQVMRVRSVLEAQGIDGAIRLLNETMANPDMGEAVKDLYITVGKRHAQMTYSRLLHETRRRKFNTPQLETKGFGFNSQWVAFITNYLDRFLLEKITIEISNTTRNALLHALTVGYMGGMSVDQQVDALKDWPYERFQAARIVRTETNRAANVGATAQADTSEYEQVKEWLSAGDWRVRGRNPKDHADHWGLNGQKIDAGDLFHDRVSGDYLQFPGDPKASAATTCNCRCQAAYTFKRDKNGNLIKKRKTTTVIYPSQIRRPQIVTI